MNEYPKWVAVEGEGHPDMPGHVLCEDEAAEKALKPAKPKK